jgi:hypothetical protein
MTATTARTLIISLTDEQYQELETWKPCTRVRLVPVDDETARLEIDTRATCMHCHGGGTWEREGIRMRCKFCAGTGLR